MLGESTSETSDPNISNNATRMSDDTDMSLIAESRGIHLQSLNDALQRENSKLRAQFEEAVRVANQVDDIHKKNSCLANENRELKSQKEDLERRLQIALGANEELKANLDAQKETIHEQRRLDLDSIQKEISKSENQAKVTADNFNQHILRIEEEKEQIKVSLKMVKNIVKRIQEAASHYFEQNYESPEDLITFLNQPPLKVKAISLENKTDNFNNYNNNQISNSLAAKDDTIAEIEKKKQRALKKLEEAKQRILNLNEKIIQMKKEANETEKTYLSKIEEMNMKIHQINEDQQIVDEDNKHRESILNQKIVSLQTEIKKLKENNSNLTAMTNCQIPLQQQSFQTGFPSNSQNLNNNNNKNLNNLNNCPENGLNGNNMSDKDRYGQSNPSGMAAFEAEVDLLNQKISDLTKIEKNQENKINELTQKGRNLEIERNELKKKHDQVFNDFSALNLIHESTVKEVETLRTVLHSHNPANSSDSKTRKKIRIMKNHIYKLENELNERQKKESELLLEQEDHQRALDDCKNLFRKENENLKLHISELNDEIKSMTKELNSVKYLNNSPIRSPTLNSPSAFVSSPINSNDINCTSNSEQQIPLKIYEMEKCFKKKMEEVKKEKQEAIESKIEIENQFNEFIAKISSVVSPCKPVLFYTDLKNNDIFTDSICDMKNKFDLTKQENQILNSIIKHLNEVLKFSSSDASSFANVQQKIDEFYSKFLKNKNELKKKVFLIQQLQQQISQFSQSKDLYETKVRAHREKESKFLDVIKSLEAENDELKRLNNSQEMQISNFEKIQEENDFSNQKKLNEASVDRKKIEASFRDQIYSLKSKIEELLHKCNELDESNSKLKSRIRNQKVKICELNVKKSNFLNEIEKQRLELEQNFGDERTNYEKVIKELQNDSEKQRKDIEKLGTQLTESENKLKKAKCYVKSIKEEQILHDKNLCEKQEQLEREKQIVLGTVKTHVLAAESDYAAKLEERRGKWEKEKRKIFSYVADQFREFFNPIDPINEKSFKCVIHRVKEELIKLNSANSQIRKLVGAEVRQRTEDAVAQMVMQ